MNYRNLIKVAAAITMCAAAAVMALEGCVKKSVALDEVKSRYATMECGVRIHYKEVGDSQDSLCILFVHGFGCDLNSWREQCGYFAGKARELFVDLPGYGLSDKPDTAYTLDFFADAVRTVMNEANAKRAVLVGHSLGTPVCRQLALTYPQLVCGLVDVDGVYCFYPADSVTVAAYQEFADSFDCDSVSSVIAGFVESLCTEGTPASVREYALSVMPATPRFIASSTMKNLVEERYWTGERIDVPVLAFASVNSQIPQGYGEILGSLYPELDYRELDSCGHFIMMEQPALFNAALDRWISAHGLYKPRIVCH